MAALVALSVSSDQGCVAQLLVVGVLHFVMLIADSV